MDEKLIKKVIKLLLPLIIAIWMGILGLVNKFNVFELNSPFLSYLNVMIFFSIGILILKSIAQFRKTESSTLELSINICELAVICYIQMLTSPLIWAFFLITVLIIYTAYFYGNIYSLVITFLAVIGVISGESINTGIAMMSLSKALEISTILIVYLFAWYMISIFRKERFEGIELLKNKQTALEKEISERLAAENEVSDCKQLYEKLEATNKKLEENNQRLNKSAAEFFTLQQISQAIATILDIQELLKFVNDVIIGVIGVTYSSILIIDRETGKLEIPVTNIYSESELETFKNVLECDKLIKVLKNGVPVIDNDVSKEKYEFTSEREIKSLICIPLLSKNESYGLVIVEHGFKDAFNDGHLKFLTTISNQISVALENVGLYEKMQIMATTDALTNLYNRLYFNERLSKELAKAYQNNYPISIVILDIDLFKKFNDTYGHLFGDLVLRTIARLLKENVRENDVAARFGGEEFVIIMPNTTAEEAFDLVEILRQKISEQHIRDGSVSAGVTASFGIAAHPNNGITEADLLSAADTALYKAKTSGRNCTKIYDGDKSK